MRIGSTILALTLSACAAGTATAQQALYSNGSLDPNDPGIATGAITASGVAAPSPFVWSETPSEAGNANAVAGFASHLAAGFHAFRFADDFTITTPGGWRVASVSLFAYSPNALLDQPPFTGANVRVWRGRPGNAGSVVVFGDTTTNRATRFEATNVLRVFNTVVQPFPPAPDVSRKVWRTDIDLGGLFLPPGQYWIDWQYTAPNIEVEVFTPPITLVGVRSLAHWNAVQLKTNSAEGGAWMPVLDAGKPAFAADLPQDLPFIIRGSSGCGADYNLDGQINANDVGAFLTAYFADITNGTTLADFDANGVINAADVGAFLTEYYRTVGPCP